MSRKSGRSEGQQDLFSVDGSAHLAHRLDALAWPDQEKFPVNRASTNVRSVVWADLETSTAPVLVAGYSSIAELVDFIAAWDAHDHDGEVRVVLGAEPFQSSRRSFASPRAAFSEDVTDYWFDRGISLRHSAQVIVAIEALRAGRVKVRAVVGQSPLHAKVFVGDDAATTGSSNFTAHGLGRQAEANARFERDSERKRFDGLVEIADNFWKVGEDWNDEFVALLDQLLRVVTWREALARACAELLEGEWAAALLKRTHADAAGLWPSQLVGMAQAMWIIDNVGSVLVADATGSGKTRMGVHLVRAVQDRLWSTGRIRDGYTALVCPPAVEQTWQREATACGLTIDTISHGKLSRSHKDEQRLERVRVHRAQVLAVDEAHNFLNKESVRTKVLRRNLADNVLLFTATPISRSSADLLELVALLGPDNFEDRTHATLKRLERGRAGAGLTEEEAEELRSEIQRFTLRRTKRQINALVDRDESAYIHPTSGRVCRYPQHRAEAYSTGETPGDSAAADAIRSVTRELTGIAWLPTEIAVPKSLRQIVSDERWLHFRLASAAGLAAHHVLGALRSSRAALFEHLHGTEAATAKFDLPGDFKNTETGATLAKIRTRSTTLPAVTLDCQLPRWLEDLDAWRDECEDERQRYERIAELLDGVSGAREEQKASLLTELANKHERVLAFDRHLISLSVLKKTMADASEEVLIATGQAGRERRMVEEIFAPTAEGNAIALCSDAMNEGLNLQGAAALVHLDLPTTLRVAEQRVGRVDRMDSPHEEIEVWWPKDGAAFATRARETLVRRIEESETLIGSNLIVPSFVEEMDEDGGDQVVDVAEMHRKVDEGLAEPTDDLFDAIDPVRRLAEGPEALITPKDYREARESTARVIARVAPIASSSPWAFFAVRSSSTGAPRWMFVDPVANRVRTDLAAVANELRSHLNDDPPNLPLDDGALHWLSACLDQAARAEIELLPRRMKRALAQMRDVMHAWKEQCQRTSDERSAARWDALAAVATISDDQEAADLVVVAERWLRLIAPVLESHRESNRRRRYVLIGDVTKSLKTNPLDLDFVEEAFKGLPVLHPLHERISACILGVPPAAMAAALDAQSTA